MFKKEGKEMPNSNQKFTELHVEKLNIVDKEGISKMTLFNQNNVPPIIMNG